MILQADSHKEEGIPGKSYIQGAIMKELECVNCLVSVLEFSVASDHYSRRYCISLPSSIDLCTR